MRFKSTHIERLSMNGFDEKQYLRGMADGNEKDFSILFVHFYPQLKHFIKSLLQDEPTAEDLASDIFVRIWQNRHTLDSIDNFGAYLHCAAKNEVFHHIQRQLLLKNYHEAAYTDQHYADLIHHDLHMEEELYAKDLDMLIDAVVEGMPPRRRSIFEMSRRKGISNDDIARELAIDKRTVENHLTQALGDLRKAMGRAH